MMGQAVVIDSASSRKKTVGAQLTLARVYAEREGAFFRSDGTCMYPTIRPGDVLRINPCAVAEARVGDIAVCRKGGRLFSHRIVERGEEQGRPYVITRPDRRPSDDPPAFDENFLGVVAAIERRGRQAPLVPGPEPQSVRLYHALCLKRIEWGLRLRLAVSGGLLRLRSTKFHSILVQTRMKLARPDVAFFVRVPVPALGDDVFRRLNPEEFDADKDWRGRPVRVWTLTLHLDGAVEPAAWMKFSCDDANCWDVDSSYVQPRWHGARLEKQLKNRAEEILAGKIWATR